MTPNRNSSAWSVATYASMAHAASDTPQARFTGIGRRDTALLMATRALAGVDLALARAPVARVSGPGLDVTLAVLSASGVAQDALAPRPAGVMGALA